MGDYYASRQRRFEASRSSASYTDPTIVKPGDSKYDVVVHQAKGTLRLFKENPDLIDSSRQFTRFTTLDGMVRAIDERGEEGVPRFYLVALSKAVGSASRRLI